ncbi:hypothetical protein DM02DRAFT_353857 [Periconia macrospinosa]|uniref:Secreted protein n=1 Tax=Periconia macrospinosa TaxID=97972 RepID=A0A2V1EAS6_9PLEO|nr:hypothetical protein DM02DRAFT_353857 [Periconia macrospinosa]
MLVTMFFWFSRVVLCSASCFGRWIDIPLFARFFGVFPVFPIPCQTLPISYQRIEIACISPLVCLFPRAFPAVPLQRALQYHFPFYRMGTRSAPSCGLPGWPRAAALCYSKDANGV